jgi:outer membrane cobalamin receptor
VSITAFEWCGRRALVMAFIAAAILAAVAAHATIFGIVQGTARDASHQPVRSATVTLQSETSAWKAVVRTDRQGRYAFLTVPLGDYRLSAGAPGLTAREQRISIAGGASLTADVDLAVAAVSANVEVTAQTVAIDTRSPAVRTTVTRADIARTPGADDPNSLSMITDFVPSAYMVHDQLHIRGGHQTDWLIDGVAVPNTNIASNVGPQFDPRDVDYLEVQRGGYSAEYGDRTYGVFNVVPRSGFERNREAGVDLGFGSFQRTDGHFSIGSHTDRFAYYASGSVNRSNYGLETPGSDVIHDAASGAGAFTSLGYQPGAADQLRLVASARADQYDIPNDPDAEAAGIRDRQTERDAFVNASWLHLVGSTTLLTVAPFFHRNSANFDGGPDDPIVARDHRRSQYAGAQASVAATVAGHDLRIGGFGFSQRDRSSVGLRSNDGSGLVASEDDNPHGSVTAAYAEDAYDVASWLTVRGGVRFTRFSGGIDETATSPRAGFAARLPWANAVFRASYGEYYQAPPLSTVSGPLLAFAVEQGFDFLPLRGERDRQAEAGLAVPVAGWTFDAAVFRTKARNFFDHDVLGDSNIFFPLTIDRAFIRGVEATVKSPEIANRGVFHLAFSHQTAEGEGGVVGGLTDFSPPEEGRFFLDHDQRNTLSAGGTARLPGSAWVSVNVAYGSGFLEGDGPGHLPSHTTVDVAAGTMFGDWSVKVAALNVANKRYLLDESNTFGGTHFASPRQISAQLGYRFHY